MTTTSFPEAGAFPAVISDNSIFPVGTDVAGRRVLVLNLSPSEHVTTETLTEDFCRAAASLCSGGRGNPGGGSLRVKVDRSWYDAVQVVAGELLARLNNTEALMATAKQESDAALRQAGERVSALETSLGIANARAASAERASEAMRLDLAQIRQRLAERAKVAAGVISSEVTGDTRLLAAKAVISEAADALLVAELSDLAVAMEKTVTESCACCVCEASKAGVVPL